MESSEDESMRQDAEKNENPSAIDGEAASSSPADLGRDVDPARLSESELATAVDDEPATAELVSDVVDAEFATSPMKTDLVDKTNLGDEADPFVASMSPPVKLNDESLLPRNIQAKGGAVGSLVVGLLAFFGSFITSYSVINAVIGLLLGIWGLSSRHRRIAVIGMVLSMLGLLFSAVQITELIQWYLEARAESAEIDF